MVGLNFTQKYMCYYLYFLEDYFTHKQEMIICFLREYLIEFLYDLVLVS